MLNLDLDTVDYPSIKDHGADVTVADCNFWQSAAHVYHTGIQVKGGTLHCTGSRFIGFNGASIGAAIATDPTGHSLYPALLVTGNQFLGFQCRASVLAGDGKAWVVSGNRFVGAAGASIAVIPDRSVFTGNYVEVTNPHACLNINQGAQYTTVTGNTFINSSGGATIEGGLVVSVKQGISYSGGCSHCVITGNTCGTSSDTGTSGIHVDASPALGNLITGNITT